MQHIIRCKVHFDHQLQTLSIQAHALTSEKQLHISKWHYSCFVRLNFQVVLGIESKEEEKTHFFFCAHRISGWHLYLGCTTLWRTLNILFTLSMIVQCLSTYLDHDSIFFLMVSNKMWIEFTTKTNRILVKSVKRTVVHTQTNREFEKSDGKIVHK